MTNLDNILLLTDSYKVTHHRQYPPGTRHVYSYFESRGGRFPETIFFGLQYFLKKYLLGKVVTEEKIRMAESILGRHFAGQELFHKKGWLHIAKKHNGRLPVRIKAVPEGTSVPTGNVLMTVENTDPDCYWLVNYLETLLVQVWYPSTIATHSGFLKKRILRSLQETGSPDELEFKLHDFGFRGVSSVETAALGSAAHLVHFLGTDTLAGLVMADEYYHEPNAGFSIPASEHSTMTSWGKENEGDAMENMLDQFPTGLVAVVSDSFDIYKACRDLWGSRLKEKILARDGALVIRPDSGDPLQVLPKLLDILGEAFGTDINAKGYRVLPSQVRLIQGDGVDADAIDRILDALQKNGWSADNLAFGSGGGLLQKFDRDTSKYAFKCSEVTVESRRVEVFKDPVTDPGKRSKRGRLKLVCNPDKSLETLCHTPGDDDCRAAEFRSRPDLLETVFQDGMLKVDHHFDEIRSRAGRVTDRPCAEDTMVC